MNWHIARWQSGNTKVDIGNKRPATFSYISIPEVGLLQNSPYFIGRLADSLKRRVFGCNENSYQLIYWFAPLNQQV